MYFEGAAAIGAELLPRQLYQKGIFFSGPPPTTVNAGIPTTLKWYGGSGNPVKITLNKGMQGDAGAETVTTIASDALSPVTGGSYTWTPAKDIPNGNEYFYEIYQDVLNSAQSGTLIYSGGAAPSAAIPTSLTATGSSTSTLRTHKTTQTTLSKAAATSVVVSVVTSIPTSSPTSVTSPQPESSPPIAAVAVGASIAAAFFLVLAGIGFFFYRRRRRSRRTPEDDYHDNHSTTELVQKHPEVSSNSEIFEIRADRDVRELGTGGALGWLPSGGSRQELPSPISPMYRHELPTEESLCELEGSVVGDYDKSREAVGKGHDRPSEETETSSNRDRGSTGSGRRITLR